MFDFTSNEDAYSPWLSYVGRSIVTFSFDFSFRFFLKTIIPTIIPIKIQQTIIATITPIISEFEFDEEDDIFLIFKFGVVETEFVEDESAEVVDSEVLEVVIIFEVNFADWEDWDVGAEFVEVVNFVVVVRADAAVVVWIVVTVVVVVVVVVGVVVVAGHIHIDDDLDLQCPPLTSE